MILYEFLTEKILPLFIDSLTFIEYKYIFDFLFVTFLSYIVIWFVLIMPFRFMRKLIHAPKKEDI